MTFANLIPALFGGSGEIWIGLFSLFGLCIAIPAVLHAVSETLKTVGMVIVYTFYILNELGKYFVIPAEEMRPNPPPLINQPQHTNRFPILRRLGELMDHPSDILELIKKDFTWSPDDSYEQIIEKKFKLLFLLGGLAFAITSTFLFPPLGMHTTLFLIHFLLAQGTNITIANYTAIFFATEIIYSLRPFVIGIFILLATTGRSLFNCFCGNANQPDQVPSAVSEVPSQSSTLTATISLSNNHNPSPSIHTLQPSSSKSQDGSPLPSLNKIATLHAERSQQALLDESSVRQVAHP